MSISQRQFRALVLEYHDAGTEGIVDSTWLAKPSGDDDQMWHCSRIEPTGREVLVGTASEHRVDAVFGFAAECPITIHDAIKCGDESYLVRAILTRDFGHDEWQVYAERVAELALTTS